MKIVKLKEIHSALSCKSHGFGLQPKIGRCMKQLLVAQQYILNDFTAQPYYDRQHYQKIRLGNRVNGIVGARGAGKTTLPGVYSWCGEIENLVVGAMKWTHPSLKRRRNAPEYNIFIYNLKKESPMKDVTLLALDIAKNIFHAHGVNSRGKKVLSKVIKRKELLSYIANIPICKIVMEACGGANYWGRQFKSLGHEVILISPQHVKPFVKHNKNDKNDAEAIAVAAAQDGMPTVPLKSLEQQSVQSIHRIRSGYVKRRTELCNQIRGLLQEYGVVAPQGVRVLEKNLPLIIENKEKKLPGDFLPPLFDLYEELGCLSSKIKTYDKQLHEIYMSNEICQRLGKISGIGPITATAMLFAVVDPHHFKNGRHFSASLGLVPLQNSSGGKQKLLGMSKRGDPYIRTLLIHGGRAVIRTLSNKTDSTSIWLRNLVLRRGKNKAAVAYANKIARVILSMLKTGSEYMPNYERMV